MNCIILFYQTLQLFKRGSKFYKEGLNSIIEYGPPGPSRALCRIKLLPVTHVLVDTWMLTVKPVYKLLNVSDDLKWTTNTHVTPFHSLSRHN